MHGALLSFQFVLPTSSEFFLQPKLQVYELVHCLMFLDLYSILDRPCMKLERLQMVGEGGICRILIWVKFRESWGLMGKGYWVTKLITKVKESWKLIAIINELSDAIYDNMWWTKHMHPVAMLCKRQEAKSTSFSRAIFCLCLEIVCVLPVCILHEIYYANVLVHCVLPLGAGHTCHYVWCAYLCKITFCLIGLPVHLLNFMLIVWLSIVYEPCLFDIRYTSSALITFETE